MGVIEELSCQRRQRRAAVDGRNGERDFHGETRTNNTHESRTNPDAKLYRKGNGQPAKLCFMGHALMENRSGLVVQTHLGPRHRHLPKVSDEARRVASLVG